MGLTVKKWLTIAAVAGLVGFQGLAMPSDASAIETRKAAEVPSVWGTMTANIILADRLGATRRGELDLAAIAAYNDRGRMRLDINLRSPWGGRTRAIYAFRVIGQGFEEMYAYAPLRKTFHYRKTLNGTVTESRELTQDTQSDYATMGSIDGVQNRLVALYIDKNKHFGGTPGANLSLTIQCFSGTYDTDLFTGKERVKVVDETPQVLLTYIR